MLNKNNSKFISSLIILLSLFLIVFFTKDQFFKLQENLDSRDFYKEESVKKDQELSEVNSIKSKLEKSDSKELEEVKKYMIDFSEDELISYIYGHIINNVNVWWRYINIKSLSLDRWKTNEIWFTEWSLNLNIRIASENTMMDLIKFFVGEDSKYKFFINNFSYKSPGQDSSWKDIPFNLTIPLRVYYK